MAIDPLETERLQDSLRQSDQAGTPMPVDEMLSRLVKHHIITEQTRQVAVGLLRTTDGGLKGLQGALTRLEKRFQRKQDSAKQKEYENISLETVHTLLEAIRIVLQQDQKSGE